MIYDNWKRVQQRLELGLSKKDPRLEFYSYEQTKELIRSRCVELDYVVYSQQSHFEFVSVLAVRGSLVALDLETTGLDPFKDKIYSIAFSLEVDTVLKSYFVLWPDLEFYLKVNLADFLYNNVITFHNAKFDLKFLVQVGFSIDKIDFRDSQISAYLDCPGRKTKLKHLSAELLNFYYESYKTVTDGKAIQEVPIDKLAKYNCSDTLATYRLEQTLALFRELKDDDLLHLELEVCKILTKMELLGISVNRNELEQIKGRNKSLLIELGTQLKHLVSIDNLKSVVQLRKVLFVDLSISGVGIKRTKTGLVSTDDSVIRTCLERYNYNKESTQYKFLEVLLQFRALDKVQGTFVEGILDRLSEQDRVHTSFNQCVTTTGRLSSSNPNLQNLPKEYRKSFVPSQGKKLVAIDYSQCELRILAHFSGEPTLVDAFNLGLDPHLEVAKRLLYKEEISSEERRICKTINFGVIYGMEASRLANMTGYSPKEAEKFLQDYWKQFPQIANYMKSVYFSVLERGYTETLLGRKRYFEFYNKVLLNEIKSKLSKCRSFEEKLDVMAWYNGSFSEYEAKILREAGNAPIQGSNADITKLAMVACDKAIKKHNFNANLLLQIHDELVWEVSKKEVSDFIEVMQEEMIKVIDLRVPLKVDCHYADNWSETK